MGWYTIPTKVVNLPTRILVRDVPIPPPDLIGVMRDVPMHFVYTGFRMSLFESEPYEE